MVVACADFCFNVIAFQDEVDADEMDANKKKRKAPRGRDRHKKWLRDQAKLASSSQSSLRSASLVDALHLEVAKYNPAERAKEWQREWKRKVPAGGARGPRAAASSQNQLVL